MADSYERVSVFVGKSSSCCSGDQWTVEYSPRNVDRLYRADARVESQGNGRSVVIFEATDPNGRKFRHNTPPFPDGEIYITSKKEKRTSYIITLEGSDPTRYFS